MTRTNVEMLASQAAELSLRGQELTYPDDSSTFMDTPEYQLEYQSWSKELQYRLDEALSQYPKWGNQKQYDYLLQLLPSAR